ncbi:MAG: hypothetical protein ABIQ11_05300, partial [Saprospiraceae bacterium]
MPAVNTGAVITTNNCGGSATVTFVGDVITNQTCVNRYTLTRTYRATDACGNSATCSQVITVFDNTAPVITFTDPLLAGVPNGGTVEVQCYGQDPAWDLPGFEQSSVSVTDNCAGDVTTMFTPILVDEGDCDVEGYIVRYRMTWTATDACGNSSSAFVFMDLIDTIAPVIFGIPDDVTVSCDEIPELPALVYATDECLCACIVLSEESEPADGCQNGQVIVRTWTAVDDCGNVRIETQNITLIDEDGPEMVMMQPELIGVRNGSILEYTCNEGGIPEFFDLLNAESVSSLVSCGTSGSTTFNAENHIANNCEFWGYVENRVFTWEMIDQCGNETTMTITARLVDREAPQIVGVPDTTCIGDPMLREVEAIDNCNNASVKFWDVPVPNPCGSGMAMRRTYEAVDECGNMTRDTAILIPNNEDNPSIEFISPALREMEPNETLQIECSYQGSQYSTYGIEDVRATDGCGSAIIIRFEERLVQSDNCQNGTVATGELVWTATDVCGNSSQIVLPVNVVDETGPEFVNFEVEITIGCNEELPELFGTDNCGEVRIVSIDSIIPGLCIYQYEIMRRITATDLCGNRTTRIQRVRVGSSGPIIEGVIEEVCDDLSIPEVTAFDPCSGDFVAVVMTEEFPDVDCTDGRVIERIWSATDSCGNLTEIH